MSAFSRGGMNETCAGLAAVASGADFGDASMRERLLAVRDTMIVLSMQVVFRVSLLLRHFNY
jgi:hypothetical protein